MARDRRAYPYRLQSDFRPLRQTKGIINLDPKITNGAFQLYMVKQKLNGAQIACLPINVGCLRPTHGVGAIYNGV
jgi:hypothetical protein